MLRIRIPKAQAIYRRVQRKPAESGTAGHVDSAHACEENGELMVRISTQRTRWHHPNFIVMPVRLSGEMLGIANRRPVQSLFDWFTGLSKRILLAPSSILIL
jgi:hypothetical protein